MSTINKRGNITITANVWRNDDKRHPHFRGKMEVDGEQYDVALWINRELCGVPVHMTGTVSDPSNSREQPTRDEPQAAPYRGKNPPVDVDEDDIPF